jgi:hypothetical protein
MTDIFFSELTQDIVLTNGDFLFTGDISPAEVIKQNITATLKTFLGEWFLDDPENPRVGVPYWQSLFAEKVPTTELADTIFRSAIMSVEGVQTVENMTFDYSPTTRILLVSFRAITEAGIIEDNLPIGV